MTNIYQLTKSLNSEKLIRDLISDKEFMFSKYFNDIKIFNIDEDVLEYLHKYTLHQFLFEDKRSWRYKKLISMILNLEQFNDTDIKYKVKSLSTIIKGEISIHFNLLIYLEQYILGNIHKMKMHQIHLLLLVILNISDKPIHVPADKTLCHLCLTTIYRSRLADVSTKKIKYTIDNLRIKMLLTQVITLVNENIKDMSSKKWIQYNLNNMRFIALLLISITIVQLTDYPCINKLINSIEKNIMNVIE